MSTDEIKNAYESLDDETKAYGLLQDQHCRHPYPYHYLEQRLVERYQPLLKKTLLFGVLSPSPKDLLRVLGQLCSYGKTLKNYCRKISELWDADEILMYLEG